MTTDNLGQLPATDTPYSHQAPPRLHIFPNLAPTPPATQNADNNTQQPASTDTTNASQILLYPQPTLRPPAVPTALPIQPTLPTGQPQQQPQQHTSPATPSLIPQPNTTTTNNALINLLAALQQHLTAPPLTNDASHQTTPAVEATLPAPVQDNPAPSKETPTKKSEPAHSIPDIVAGTVANPLDLREYSTPPFTHIHTSAPFHPFHITIT